MSRKFLSSDEAVDKIIGFADYAFFATLLVVPWLILASFWAILINGVMLVILQIFLAYRDRYITQAQMRARGVYNGWSIMEHGGMWADLFIISPMAAYFMSTHLLEYLSLKGAACLAISIAFWAFLARDYAREGVKTPEAHAHPHPNRPGKPWITPAGWVHLFFAVVATWVIVLTYLSPGVSLDEKIFLSTVLIPFSVLGVAKFSRRWKLDAGAKWQIVGMFAASWGATAAHRLFF